MNNKYKKEEFNYKYNMKENLISISKIPFNNCKLKEKTFLSFKLQYQILFQVLILNKIIILLIIKIHQIQKEI